MTKTEKTYLYEYIGNQIKLLRKKADFSQSDLADKLELSRVSVVNIEKGRQHPSIHMLIDLSRIFGINLTDILSNDNWKSNQKDDKIKRMKRAITMSSADKIESDKIIELYQKITNK